MYALPRVSVVLPVRNGELYLAEAIASVLAQTVTAIELIVVDDDSTDRSAAIAQEAADRDPRVAVLRAEHRGMAAALNTGIAAARAPYVARMDADDIALPRRLETQLDHLDVHEDCVAVGCAIEIVDEAGAHVGWRTFAGGHDGIVAALLVGSVPMAHPTVVMRRDALLAVGGYATDLFPTEDLDLWVRLSQIGLLANLDEVLLRYRRHENAVSVRHREEQLAISADIVGGARARLGLPPLRRSRPSAGRSRSAHYHFECARTALLSGTRPTALRHVLQTITNAPLWTPAYLNLIACMVPQRMLRRAAALRGKLRLRNR